MKRFPLIPLACAVAIALLLWGDGLGWSWGVGSKPDAVTFVFEKDQHAIPAPVLSALNKLNRQGVMATTHEVDTTDGTNEIPEQYKLVVPAAQAAGLPALVVSGKGKVIRTVKDPKTEEAVLEAAR